MNKKKKLLVAIAALALSMLPTSLLANEGEVEEEEKVCYYRKNCQGELVYVCEDESEEASPLMICPPKCWEEE